LLIGLIFELFSANDHLRNLILEVDLLNNEDFYLLVLFVITIYGSMVFLLESQYEIIKLYFINLSKVD
jgi:hypothetical protein